MIYVSLHFYMKYTSCLVIFSYGGDNWKLETKMGFHFVFLESLPPSRRMEARGGTDFSGYLLTEFPIFVVIFFLYLFFLTHHSLFPQTLPPILTSLPQFSLFIFPTFSPCSSSFSVSPSEDSFLSSQLPRYRFLP